APIQLVMFIDYECEHCTRIDKDIQILRKQYPELLSVRMKHYPLCTACNYSLKTNAHPSACRAACAVETAGMLKGNDGFWKMHRWLFDHKGAFTDLELRQGLRDMGYAESDMFLRTMDSAEPLRSILADITDAEALQIEGTPLVLINGEELKGVTAQDAVVRAVRAVADKVMQLAPAPDRK